MANKRIHPHHIHAFNAFFLAALAFLSLLLGAVGSRVSLASTPATAGGQTWQQVWGENFDMLALDNQSWTQCDGKNDERYVNLTHVRGCAHDCPSSPPISSGQCAELAWYQEGNLSVTGGSLVLTSRYQPTEICSWLANPSNISGNCPSKRAYYYASARAHTGSADEVGTVPAKRSFGHGYYEASMKLSSVNGMLPSFRLLPDNMGVSSPRAFEITVMQGGEHTPNTVNLGISSVSGSSHQTCSSSQSLSGGYHSYGVDWQSSYARFYLDGVLCFTITDSAILADAQDRPMFIEFNAGVGAQACVDAPSPCPTSTAFPTETYVDWVKVYTLKTIQTPVIQSFDFSPEFPTVGQDTTLTWKASATACTMDHGVGNVLANGTKIVNPTIDTIYTLSCSRDGQVATRAIDVEVFPKDVVNRARKRPLAAAFVQDETTLPPSIATALGDFEVNGRNSNESSPSSPPILGLSSSSWKKAAAGLSAAAAICFGLYLIYLSRHKRLQIPRFIPL